MKRFLISLLSLTLVFAMLFGLAGCGAKKEDQTKIPGETATMWTAKTTLSFSMFSYFLNAYFRSFVSNYSSDRLASMGIDTSKDLKEQIYNAEENVTWYSYIVYLAYSEISEMLAIYDTAMAQNFVLSEDGFNTIEDTIEQYKSDAEKYDVTFDEYVAKMFSDAVTPDVLRECLTIQTITSEFYGDYYKEPVYTDKNAEKYYNENKNSYLHYDMLTITVPQEYVSTFTSCKSEEEFYKAAKETIAETYFDGDYDKYADTIDPLVKDKKKVRCGYVSGSDICEWVFKDGRAAWDVYTVADEDNEKTTIYILLPKQGSDTEVLYRDEEPVRNFYYALYADEKSAKEAYDKFVSAGAKIDDFKAIVDEKDGGTITNVDRGDFTGPLADWAFNKDTTAGSYACVTVDEAGTYLVYMLENGEASWLVDVKTTMKNKAYQDALEKLVKADPSEYDETIVNKAEIMQFSTSQKTES